jgi:hypothetical protein
MHHKLLKAGERELAQWVIARQLHNTDSDVKTENAVFSMWSTPSYIMRTGSTDLRVEASSNTSIIALQVIGGNEKGTQCLGV